MAVEVGEYSATTCGQMKAFLLIPKRRAGRSGARSFQIESFTASGRGVERGSLPEAELARHGESDAAGHAAVITAN